MSTADMASVRELYRYVLRLGEGVGVTRAPPTTPIEHLPSLQGSLDPADRVREVTDAYLTARYADVEASATQLRSLREDVRQIHPKGGEN